jgi:hypothetical protein
VSLHKWNASGAIIATEDSIVPLLRLKCGLNIIESPPESPSSRQSSGTDASATIVSSSHCSSVFHRKTRAILLQIFIWEH